MTKICVFFDVFLLTVSALVLRVDGLQGGGLVLVAVGERVVGRRAHYVLQGIWNKI